MSAPIKVVFAGATGQTGSMVVQALLDSPTNFDITAIVRPGSANKTATLALKEKGVKVALAELAGPQDELVKILQGADTVISTVNVLGLQDQKPLVDAAKKAGVKRFIPCNFGPVMPPVGVMGLREIKEDVINHIKKAGVGYTIIDVAWWYSIFFVKLPSGRTDYMLGLPLNDFRMPVDGNVPLSLVDLRSVGPYVARIIADPRTLNKYVHVYDVVKTVNEIWDVVDQASGEKLVREYISVKELEEGVAAAKEAIKSDPTNIMNTFSLYTKEYLNSWGARGDSTPERAAYLGYLDVHDLYPDVDPASLLSFWEEVVAGKAEPAYADRTYG